MWEDWPSVFCFHGWLLLFCSWHLISQETVRSSRSQVMSVLWIPFITFTLLFWWQKQYSHPFNGPFPGLPRWAGTRKVKPIWILLKQETVRGSGISWAICKSASCSRQITTPAPHHSLFYRPDALPAAQYSACKKPAHFLPKVLVGKNHWSESRREPQLNRIWICLCDAVSMLFYSVMEYNLVEFNMCMLMVHNNSCKMVEILVVFKFVYVNCKWLLLLVSFTV